VAVEAADVAQETEAATEAERVESSGGGGGGISDVPFPLEDPGGELMLPLQWPGLLRMVGPWPEPMEAVSDWWY
jgi:hypothetical protein